MVWSGVQHLVEQFEDCAHELCPALLRVHGSDLGAGRKCREVQERCRVGAGEVQEWCRGGTGDVQRCMGGAR